MSSALSPIEVFCSYAPEDEPMLHKLEVHLSVLKQQGLIATLLNLPLRVARERALSIYEQRLGANHPHTRIIRGNYTQLMRQLEDGSPS